jgi:transcriptional regulator with PAS, ATPase and Fis domain/CHASE2 domain-containing sensor protein
MPRVQHAMAQAVAIALLATLLAWSLWVSAPAVMTALERSPYDTWLRLRDAQPVSPTMAVIARDPASEARFGASTWNRTLLASMITALDRAGAAVIVVDAQVLSPSSVALGGPTSDAMLAETIKSSGNVIVPFPTHLLDGTTREPEKDTPAPADQKQTLVHPAWPPAPLSGNLPRAGLSVEGSLPLTALSALNAGHTVVLPDPDGTVRTIPLFVNVRGRSMPALGLAAASTYFHVSPQQIEVSHGGRVVLKDAHLPDGSARDVVVPTDRSARMWINFAAPDLSRTVPTHSFLTVWEAIDSRDRDTLRDWFAGKIVFLQANPTQATHRTPVGSRIAETTLQLNILNTIVRTDWISEPSSAVRLFIAVAMGAVAAYCLMVLPGWAGLATVVGMAIAYPLIAILGLIHAGILLPIVIPLFGLMISSVGGVLSAHLNAKHRMRRLEGTILKVEEDLAAVRRALVCQESSAEALEEDLDAARAQVHATAGQQTELARTAEALRTQLADAHAREEETRQRMQQLQRQLTGLRSVSKEASPLTEAEQERLRQECEQMGILTCDAGVLAVFRDLKKAARATLPVLILGEPGTGKELFARAVHRLSPRASHPFIAANMAAISPDLFESELFGHVRGSFTGAATDRRGYFELADHGTIFLDEIGDLPLIHQGKLLRVLQDKTFYRVGATSPTTVDVRVVAATNKDLAAGVWEGWFREDLYFRLTGILLRLPPLRERPDDVPVLAGRLVHDAAARAGREDVRLSDEALLALQRHAWPGNIRQLQHCLEQAVVLAEAPVITAADLRLQAAEPTQTPDRRHGDASPDPFLFDPASDEAMLTCLREHEFDMQATAKAMGCDRSTVTQRLKGLGFRALVESGGEHSQAALILAGDPALARSVELKLLDYSRHLSQAIARFPSAEAAIAGCRKRFKNLPERHFRAVEALIQRHFEQSARS